MNRGLNDSENLGQVVSFADKQVLNTWAEDPPTCNQIIGTDSTIFSAFRTADEGVTVFSAELCQSLKLNFESNGLYNGVPISRFTSDFGDIMVIILNFNSIQFKFNPLVSE